MKIPYELIEHTADIGIRVKGNNLEELFKNTALAMFDIIAERKSKSPDAGRQAQRITSHIIKQEAETLEELFINWLNELLSLSAAKSLIFSDFKINRLDDKNLEAVVSGEGSANFKFNTEIKAATYHQLKLEERDGVWTAEVIFDV